MQNYLNAPAEIIEINIKNSEKKTNLPMSKLILLGLVAGAFIAFGGAASSTAVHSITDVGLARTLAGAIFPVGLMMIVFMGGELFTGDCLIFMSVLDKRVSWRKMLTNLLIVYISNFVGALLIDVLLVYSGNLDYTGGLMGAYTIKVALGKIMIAPGQAVVSGILCNVLVCIAVLFAGAANDVTGKIWAIFFPIWSFVVCGFEHCVANMFYIPMGIMAAQNPEYVAVAQSTYGLTSSEIGKLTMINSLGNFIPVTIGNMIGGMLLVGLPLYLAHKKKKNKELLQK